MWEAIKRFFDREGQAVIELHDAEKSNLENQIKRLQDENAELLASRENTLKQLDTAHQHIRVLEAKTLLQARRARTFKRAIDELQDYENTHRQDFLYTPMFGDLAEMTHDQLVKEMSQPIDDDSGGDGPKIFVKYPEQ